MTTTETEPRTERKVRVDVPLLVSFSSGVLTVREFTLNLSIGGMFIPTDQPAEVNSQGTVKFRKSPLDEPFTIKARVVHVVPPERATEELPAGMGVELIELDESLQLLLQEYVEGGQHRSIVESLRRSARENGANLLQILRTRPVGQKMMLAVVASSIEIDALIRDGNPSVIQRLLESPRLNAHQVSMILRQRGLPPRVVSQVRREASWLEHEGVRYLFCVHPRASFNEVQVELQRLDPAGIRQLVRDMTVSNRVRAAAKLVAGQRGIRLT